MVALETDAAPAPAETSLKTQIRAFWAGSRLHRSASFEFDPH